MEADSIAWAIKRLRGHLWGTKHIIYLDHKKVENIGKSGDHYARVQPWLEYFSLIDYTLECRKGSANGDADFMSRLPLPSALNDRSRSSHPTSIDDGGIYLPHPACGPRTSYSPVHGVGSSGLVPRPDSAVLVGLHFVSSASAIFGYMGHV